MLEYPGDHTCAMPVSYRVCLKSRNLEIAIIGQKVKQLQSLPGFHLSLPSLVWNIQGIIRGSRCFHGPSMTLCLWDLSQIFIVSKRVLWCHGMMRVLFLSFASTLNRTKSIEKSYLAIGHHSTTLLNTPSVIWIRWIHLLETGLWCGGTAG